MRQELGAVAGVSEASFGSKAVWTVAAGQQVCGRGRAANQAKAAANSRARATCRRCAAGGGAAFQYGARPDAAGLVLVLTGYDTFAAHCPRSAHIVLDIIADHARSSALFGRRVLCLVQSDDPGSAFEPVGAMPVLWNRDEWSNASRRMDHA